MKQASNLGEILGRALYGELPPRPRPELEAASEVYKTRVAAEKARKAEDEERLRQQLEADAAERARRLRAQRTMVRPAPAQVLRKSRPARPARPPSVKSRIVGLLKGYPKGLTSAEVTRLLNLAKANSTNAFLSSLVDDGKVEKLGDRRPHHFALIGGAGT